MILKNILKLVTRIMAYACMFSIGYFVSKFDFLGVGMGIISAILLFNLNYDKTVQETRE